MSEEEESIWDKPFEYDFHQENGYGRPLSGVEAAQLFGSQRNDRPVEVIVKLSGEIKPKRGVPELRVDDLFSSLVFAPDGRWFFSGVLNGWGALNLLELDSLQSIPKTKDEKPKIFWQSVNSPPPKAETSTGIMQSFRRLRKAPSKLSSSLREPEFPSSETEIKAIFYLPKFKNLGYTEDSPGYVWYYSAELPFLEKQRFAHGSNIIEATSQHDHERHGTKLPKATVAHHFGHRYAILEETEEDKITYHSGLFVEWEHQEYGTIIELAWRHGIGGFRGRTNWIDDKDAKPASNLYRLMPAETRAPFDTIRAEVRVIDIPSKNLAEFKAYLDKYTGPTLRFLDPKIKNSASIKLKDRTKPDLCRYLVNRMMYSCEYRYPSLQRQDFGINCQTFSASCFDFFTLGGAKLYSSELYATEAEVKDQVEWFKFSFADGKPLPIEYENTEESEQ